MGIFIWVVSLDAKAPHHTHAYRAIDQAIKFETDIGLPGAVLFFDCPEDEMEKRLLKRGETSGRSDDNTGVLGHWKARASVRLFHCCLFYDVGDMKLPGCREFAAF